MLFFFQILFQPQNFADLKINDERQRKKERCYREQRERDSQIWRKMKLKKKYFDYTMRLITKKQGLMLLNVKQSKAVKLGTVSL